MGLGEFVFFCFLLFMLRDSLAMGGRKVCAELKNVGASWPIISSASWDVRLGFFWTERNTLPGESLLVLSLMPLGVCLF